METSLTKFKDRFHDLTVSFLWRQWSALGVSGYAHMEDRRVIDPEALLLFSTGAARYDSRLFDEILDWLQQNGEWINIQRLSRIQALHQIAEPTILAAIGDFLSQQSEHRKWKSLTRKIRPLAEPCPLFIELPAYGKRDETFLRWGWERNPPQTRGMSRFPPVGVCTSLLFKLRALFGTQSRADIIGWLLTHESGHPAAIARELGYFPRSVQLVLNDLAQSGHIQTLRAGREKHFSVRHDEWRFLVTWPEPSKFPEWEDWTGRFAVLRRAAGLIDRPDLDQLSVEVQAIEMKKILDPAAYTRTAPGHSFDPPRNELKGEDSLVASVRVLNRLFS